MKDLAIEPYAIQRTATVRKLSGTTNGSILEEDEEVHSSSKNESELKLSQMSDNLSEKSRCGS